MSRGIAGFVDPAKVVGKGCRLKAEGQKGRFAFNLYPLAFGVLSLTLLVTGIGFADHAEDAIAADDHAVLADALDGGTNFHFQTPCSNLLTDAAF